MNPLAILGLLAVGIVLAAALPRAEASVSPTIERVAAAMAFMLNEEHAEKPRSYLELLAATMVHDSERRGHPIVEYLATGWQESRFRHDAVSSSGAEGVYQQKPQYAHPSPLPRTALFDVSVATQAFGAKMDDMVADYGALSDDAWGHYHDGNILTDHGRQYARVHRRYRDRFTALLRDGHPEPRYA